MDFFTHRRSQDEAYDVCRTCAGSPPARWRARPRRPTWADAIRNSPTSKPRSTLRSSPGPASTSVSTAAAAGAARPGIAPATFDLSGGVIGGTAGFNWQTGQVVLGVEGDIDWSGVSGTTSTFCPAGCATRNDWLGTVRGRVGYAFDRFLPYVTGGLAAGDIRATTPGFAGATQTNLGWTVGAGIGGRDRRATGPRRPNTFMSTWAISTAALPAACSRPTMCRCGTTCCAVASTTGSDPRAGIACDQAPGAEPGASCFWPSGCRKLPAVIATGRLASSRRRGRGRRKGRHVRREFVEPGGRGADGPRARCPGSESRDSRARRRA